MATQTSRIVRGTEPELEQSAAAEKDGEGAPSLTQKRIQI